MLALEDLDRGITEHTPADASRHLRTMNGENGGTLVATFFQ